MKPVSERNIEIKARVTDPNEFQKRMQIAAKLTASDGEIIHQRDVFFKSNTGRLKLRYLDPPKRSQLVYYDRPDQSGPKLSSYNKIEVDEPEVLEKILSSSNGIVGVVRKKRTLYMYDRTRIHMDNVENMGLFMEFEVCLRPDETVEDGKRVAEALMEKFGIKTCDLMEGAYLDEIKNSN